MNHNRMKHGAPNAERPERITDVSSMRHGTGLAVPPQGEQTEPYEEPETVQSFRIVDGGRMEIRTRFETEAEKEEEDLISPLFRKHLFKKGLGPTDVTEQKEKPEKTLPDNKVTRLMRTVSEKDTDWKKAFIRCVPFYATLAVVTVMAWLLPLRPSVSQEEKRNLETPPSLEEQNILDGSFFRKTDTWFSDTFTGRSMWVGLNQKLKNLHGKQDIMIYGDFGKKDEIPVTEDSTEKTDKTEEDRKKDEKKDSEKNPGGSGRDEKPQTTPEAVSTPAPTPEAQATPSPEPTPEGWKGDVVGADETLNITNALIQIGDTAYEWPGFSREDGDDYCEVINRAGDIVGDRCRVFSILVPFGASVMLEPDFLTGRLNSALETEVLTYLESQMTGKNVIPVRVIDSLIAHNNEYIFFRSDHHWTALGAYYGYLEWAKAAGVTPVPLTSYTPMEQGDFLGTYYFSADMSWLMEENPDQVTAYYPPGDLRCYATDESDDTLDYLGEEYPVLFDETDAPVGYKYSTFLSGDHNLTVLVNDAIQNDSAVLLYKNSMGNPFAYYLTQHYHTVYVADYRYYRTRSLREAVEYYNIDDVVILNNTAQAEWYGGVESISIAIGD